MAWGLEVKSSVRRRYPLLDTKEFWLTALDVVKPTTIKQLSDALQVSSHQVIEGLRRFNLELFKSSLQTRIRGNTRRQGDCLIWVGSAWPTSKYKPAHVYGSAKWSDHTKEQYAHRVVWEMSNGPIPLKRAIVQTCGKTLCVELSHLEMITLSDVRRYTVARKRRLEEETNVS